MVKPVLASRRSIGFIGEGVRPANQWWLSGGISASNCVAAYQPKGAASYAASKTNLANPGTYNAADGTAYPTWDATNGWKFLKTSSQYLTTSIIPQNGYSIIARFSNVSGSVEGVLAGYHKVGARFRIQPQTNVGTHYYASGGLSDPINNILSDGVMCVAGQQGYYNASTEVATISNWTTTADGYIFIGTANNLTNYHLNGYIQALSIYNATITALQVSALTTAMNAL